jgi:F-type H+-transporting ATPase subunit epsilon
MAVGESVPGSRGVRCVVVTPEKVVVDAAVDFVAVPMYDGELGVLSGRQAMIGRLGYGELRTVRGKTTNRYYIDGGFVQVRDDVVTLLTGRAIPAEELKPQAVEAALKEALQAAATAEAQEAQTKAQQRARAQMRILQKTAQAD